MSVSPHEFDEPTPGVSDLRRRAVHPVPSVTSPASAATPPRAEAASAHWAPQHPVAAPPQVPPAEQPWSGYQARRVIEEAVPLTQQRKATSGWRARLGMKPSTRELEEAQAKAAMCRPFGRPVNIVVANPKGGAGKTPATLMLASEFGLARGGGVLAWEVHELRGTMHMRTQPNGCDATVRDFVQNLSQLAPEDVRLADVGRFVRHQIAGQYDAMVSSRVKGDQLTAQEFHELRHVLSRFYDVLVIDTANNERAPAWEAALGAADALVVPVKWRFDMVVPAIQMLEDLQQVNRDLVQRAVVVASHGANEADPACRLRMLPEFEQLAAAVIEVPTDLHVSAGGPIVADQLTPAYRRAARCAGAAVANAIQSHH